MFSWDEDLLLSIVVWPSANSSTVVTQKRQLHGSIHFKHKHTHTLISAGHWYHFSNQETMYLCIHPHTPDGYGHTFLSICVCLRICYIYSFKFTMNLRYAERVNCVQKEGCMLHIIVTAWSECLLITLWKQTLSKDLMIIHLLWFAKRNPMTTGIRALPCFSFESVNSQDGRK